MVNFVLIGFCIIAGLLFRHYNLIPKNAHKTINVWVLYIALPAVSFKYIPHIRWSKAMLFPILAVLVVWLGSWVFMQCYCKLKGYSQRTRSSLELAAGYSNTSFIGFPLIMAYFSERDISIAIISDQAQFMLLSTAGIICAIKGGKTHKTHTGIDFAIIAKRLITFPPLIGCLAALVSPAFVDLSFASAFFDKLASTVGPLALFSIGLQLQFKGWRRQWAQISAALSYKLVLAPLLVLAFALAIGLKNEVSRIAVFEAAMPTLVTSGLIAEQFKLNTRLVNLIIGVGIVLSLLTTVIWKLLITATLF